VGVLSEPSVSKATIVAALCVVEAVEEMLKGGGFVERNDILVD
jgi:hypothetical protein